MLLVEESEHDLASQTIDWIKDLEGSLETRFVALEEKHAHEVLQLIRQKKAYKEKLDQVGKAETERRVKQSLEAQRARRFELHKITFSEV